MAACGGQRRKTGHSLLRKDSADRNTPYPAVHRRFLRIRTDVFQNEHKTHQADKRMRGSVSPCMALLRSEIIHHHGFHDGRRDMAPLIRTCAGCVRRRVLYGPRLCSFPCRRTVLDHVFHVPRRSTMKPPISAPMPVILLLAAMLACPAGRKTPIYSGTRRMDYTASDVCRGL